MRTEVGGRIEHPYLGRRQSHSIWKVTNQHPLTRVTYQTTAIHWVTQSVFLITSVNNAIVWRYFLWGLREWNVGRDSKGEMVWWPAQRPLGSGSPALPDSVFSASINIHFLLLLSLYFLCPWAFGSWFPPGRTQTPGSQHMVPTVPSHFPLKTSESKTKPRWSNLNPYCWGLVSHIYPE